jgi:hypothetical protein
MINQIPNISNSSAIQETRAIHLFFLLLLQKTRKIYRFVFYSHPTNIYSFKRRLYFLVFLPLFACMKEELVAEDKKVSEPKERGLIHTYYDGKDLKKVTLLPDYIAEFSSGKSKIRDTDKSAQTVLEGGRMRILKISNGTLRSSLAKGAIPNSLQGGGDYSPVFSANGTDSSLMTLPGTIIVEMERDLSQSDLETWSRAQKIRFQKKLPLSTGFFYVFETGPGFICLDKANELRSKPGVISSSPDWYQKAFPR